MHQSLVYFFAKRNTGDAQLVSLAGHRQITCRGDGKVLFPTATREKIEPFNGQYGEKAPCFPSRGTHSARVAPGFAVHR